MGGGCRGGIGPANGGSTLCQPASSLPNSRCAHPHCAVPPHRVVIKSLRLAHCSGRCGCRRERLGTTPATEHRWGGPPSPYPACGPLTVPQPYLLPAMSLPLGRKINPHISVDTHCVTAWASGVATCASVEDAWVGGGHRTHGHTTTIACTSQEPLYLRLLLRVSVVTLNPTRHAQSTVA